MNRSRNWLLLVCMTLLLAISMCVGVSAKETPEEHRYVSSEKETFLKGVTVDKSSLAVAVGCSRKIQYEKDDSSSVLRFENDNPDIASVDSEGVVTGLKEGYACIRIYEKEQYSYVNVYVTNPKVNKTKFNYNLANYSKYENGYEIFDSSFQITGIDTSYSGYYVESVTGPDSDKVQMKIYLDGIYWVLPQKGEYTVCVMTDGKRYTFHVNAVNMYIAKHAKQAASFNKMLAMYAGETATLTVKGKPSGADITYKSSNTSVATVNSSGKVTAKSIGYATITAKVNGMTVSRKVGVGPETSIKALRYAKKNYNSTYSQEKRMSKGHYDCSSFVWRAYKSAGMQLGGSSSWAATSRDMARWCRDNNCMIMIGEISVDKMQPGDLIFEYDDPDNKYSSIYHVDLYQGNYKSITVARNKSYGNTLSYVMIGRPCRANVTGLKAVKQDGGKIKLTWNKAFGATGYIVYRSTSKNGTYKKVATVKGKTTYTNTGLTKGKTYYYKVKPYWTSSKTCYGKNSSVTSKKV